MKHTITNRLAALLLLVLGVMACTKEQTLPGSTPDTTRIPMTIRVTDGGYAASDKSTAETRAVENGYATEFTAGDQIGLYVVKPDDSYAHKNIALTLTDIGDGEGTLAWTPPADKKLYYEGAAAKYFAYYPYQSELTDDLVPSATDATRFFAGVVSGWTPKTDQSSYALYTAQDLMIGSGTVSKQESGACPLALTMSHAMALVVIETPTTKYTFDNEPAIPDYYLPAPDTQFYGFTPYSPTSGTYRYLVKPAQSGASKLMGSYKAGNTKEYEIEQNGIVAANYAHYKVDGGTEKIIEKTHTLQVGDFYMKDGTLLSKSVTPTQQQQDACIGIVYWVGDPTAKDPTLRAHHSRCTHGLVVELKEYEHILWQNFSISVQAWLSENRFGDFLFVQTDTGENDPLNNIQGYNNTKAIEAFNSYANDAYPNKRVIAVQKAVEYRSLVPAPSNSSDWYLPSAKELTLLCGKDVDDIYKNISGTANRDLINGKLQLIHKATKFLSSEYWSSSESSINGAFNVDFGSGKVGNWAKSTRSSRVRLSLAF